MTFRSRSTFLVVLFATSAACGSEDRGLDTSGTASSADLDLASAQNLITSADQIGAAPWQLLGDIRQRGNYATAPDGSKHATLVTSSGGGHALAEVVSVAPGATYTFSFYAKNNGGSGASYSVYDNSQYKDIIRPTSYFAKLNRSTYTQVSVTFTVPAGCTWVGVYPLRDSGAPVNVLLWRASLVKSSAPAVAVSVSPSAVSLAPNAKQQFAATVTGSTQTATTWSVQEASGCGSIAQTGVYTAPSAAATCHVVARSQADTSKSSTATVTVTASPPPPVVTVTVAPASTTIAQNQTATFSATVAGSTDTAVTWLVQEASGCGSITQAGVYTAPNGAATCHVVARSQADTSKSSTATVTVTSSTPAPAPAPVSVTVAPASTSVVQGQTATFNATVTGSTNLAVTWSMQESTGCGSITQSGVYTAPSSAVTCHVVAKSAADSTRSGTATVTVTAPSTGGASATLQVQGRYLNDTCGNHLVVRGIETGYWWAPSQANWLPALIGTGANAVRILWQHSNMSWTDVDNTLATLTRAGVVVYWSIGTIPAGYGLTDYRDLNYWNIANVKQIYQKYKKWIVLDAVQEYDGSDTQWRDNAISRIQQLRSWGYDGPLDVISNMSGRNLPTILAHGAEVEAADPLHKTIFGWQAYWYETGHLAWSNGWTYQGEYGMTLPQGIQAAASQTFPVQIGIEKWTEMTETQYLDYPGAMATAQQNGVGWLWWDWPPGGVGNNLSPDGVSLNALGQQVVNTDPNGIKNTSRKACGQ